MSLHSSNQERRNVGVGMDHSDPELNEELVIIISDEPTVGATVGW